MENSEESIEQLKEENARLKIDIERTANEGVKVVEANENLRLENKQLKIENQRLSKDKDECLKWWRLTSEKLENVEKEKAKEEEEKQTAIQDYINGVSYGSVCGLFLYKTTEQELLLKVHALQAENVELKQQLQELEDIKTQLAAREEDITFLESIRKREKDDYETSVNQWKMKFNEEKEKNENLSKEIKKNKATIRTKNNEIVNLESELLMKNLHEKEEQSNEIIVYRKKLEECQEDQEELLQTNEELRIENEDMMRENIECRYIYHENRGLQAKIEEFEGTQKDLYTLIENERKKTKKHKQENDNFTNSTWYYVEKIEQYMGILEDRREAEITKIDRRLKFLRNLIPEMLRNKLENYKSRLLKNLNYFFEMWIVSSIRLCYAEKIILQSPATSINETLSFSSK